MPVTPRQYITSLEAIAVGKIWNWPTAARMKTWDGWYRGQRQRAADVKGVRLDWFAYVSDFWRDALWAEAPVIDGVDDRERDALASEFAIASRWRSTAGIGAIAVDRNGGIRAVPSYAVFPIVGEEQVGQTLGVVLAYEWVSGGRAMGGSELALDAPNRITFYIVQGGRGERRIHQLDGGTIGTMVSRQVWPLIDVAVFGDWISDYERIDELVFLQETLLWDLDRRIGRYLNPHLQGPSTDWSDTDNAADGLFLPINAEEPEYSYVEVAAEGFGGAFQEFDEVRDLMRTIARLPGNVAGQGGEGRLFPQSAASQERQLFATLQRVRNLRFEVRVAVEQIGRALSRTWTVDWPDNPFATFAERAQALAPLIEPGVYEASEVRRRLDD